MESHLENGLLDISPEKIELRISLRGQHPRSFRESEFQRLRVHLGRKNQRREACVKVASERHIYKSREPRAAGGHLELWEREVYWGPPEGESISVL